MPNLPSKSTDILELLRSGTHFAREVSGRVEIVECATGSIFAVQGSTAPITEPTKFSEVLTADGTTIMVEQGMEWAVANIRQTVYQPYLLDVICQRVAEGGKLYEICQMPGMVSYSTLARWRRQHPEVGVALENARRDRAEMMRDMAVTEADTAVGDNPIDGPKLRVDTYLKVAGMDNPSYRASNKTDVNVNTTPTVIMVSTGIDLTKEVDITPSDLNTNKVEVKKLITEE